MTYTTEWECPSGYRYNGSECIWYEVYDGTVEPGKASHPTTGGAPRQVTRSHYSENETEHVEPKLESECEFKSLWQSADRRKAHLLGGGASGSAQIIRRRRQVARQGISDRGRGDDYELIDGPLRFVQGDRLVFGHNRELLSLAVNGIPQKPTQPIKAADFPPGACAIDLTAEVDGEIRHFEVKTMIYPPVELTPEEPIVDARSDQKDITLSIPVKSQTDFEQAVELEIRSMPQGRRATIAGDSIKVLRPNGRSDLPRAGAKGGGRTRAEARRIGANHIQCSSRG